MMARALRFLPPDARSWEVRGVLGGRYRGKDASERPLLDHAIWLDEHGNELGTKTVCKKVGIDHLVDAYGMRGDEAITCGVCRARVATSGLPRGSSIARSRRDADRRYTVYVAEIPSEDGKRYYVGSTARLLPKRLVQHRRGLGGHRRRLGRVKAVGVFPTRARAEEAERVVAQKLRRRGLQVESA